MATSGYRIDFEPVGRHGLCGSDRSLYEVAQELGVGLISICGGHGHCGRCRIQLIDGNASEPSTAEREQLGDALRVEGARLACQTRPRSDCTVLVPVESLSTEMRSQVEGLQTVVEIEPVVSVVELELDRPSLDRWHAADGDSVVAAATTALGRPVDSIDIAVLRDLSTRLRGWEWQLSAFVRGTEVVAVGPPHTPPVGLAVDLGTTGVAGYLVDLDGGHVLARSGTTNPQVAFGEDVITRITYARRGRDTRESLRRAAIDCLNGLAEELSAQAGVATGEIVEAVVVGNTAMHHLLLGLPTEQLALAPFVPAYGAELNVKARDVGLTIAPGAYLHLPPCIAAFVGADHVAMLLATAEHWEGRTALALDIGTNTEISLITAQGTIGALSCPSGPAFEGYRIRDGMRATTGAIEHMQIDDGEVRLQTIGDAPAIGICGSGIIDALAELHLAGVLGPNGRIQLDSHPNVRVDGEGRREFVLVDRGSTAIAVTQQDVREMLLAKAAIQSGVEVLLADAGVRAQDLDVVIIAGAFGSYLDVPAAVAIGMLPAVAPARILQVGNAAGMGAKLALTSASVRARAMDLRRRMTYLELASYPGYSRRFAMSCLLPSG